MRLADAVADIGGILLDFDGPVCPLFVDGRNLAIADRMRAVVTTPLPPDIATTYDPLVVLVWARNNLSSTDADLVDAECIAGERWAASIAGLTPGADTLLEAARKHRIPVVVVSNNSAEAIADFLGRHELSHTVQAVIGRIPNRPDLMKPHPTLVTRAIDTIAKPPSRLVLVGDSVSDVTVAHAASVRAIGFAKTPERGRQLEEAGADVLTDTITELAQALPNRLR